MICHWYIIPSIFGSHVDSSSQQNALHTVQVHPDFDHDFDNIYEDAPDVGQPSQIIIDDSSLGCK